MFILNLAVANFVVEISTIPQQFVFPTVTECSAMETLIKEVLRRLLNVPIFMSITIVLQMTVDRLKMAKSPIKYTKNVTI